MERTKCEGEKHGVATYGLQKNWFSKIREVYAFKFVKICVFLLDIWSRNCWLGTKFHIFALGNNIVLDEGVI